MELVQSMYQSYLDCGEWGDEVSCQCILGYTCKLRCLVKVLLS